jgi:LysM repeat protein
MQDHFKKFLISYLIPIISIGIIVLQSSCSDNSASTSSSLGNPSGHGPFDSSGNYVEEWADSPSKWKKRRSTNQTQIASNDTPPQNQTPITSEQITLNKSPYVSSGASPTIPYKKPQSPDLIEDIKPRVVSRTPTVKPRQKVIERSQTKEKLVSKASKKKEIAKVKSKISTKTKTALAKKPASKVSSSKVKSKVPVKKSLAGSGSVKVKKGDTLSGLAAKNKTTVAAIKKANGMKSSVLPLGKTVKIPKK